MTREKGNINKLVRLGLVGKSFEQYRTRSALSAHADSCFEGSPIWWIFFEYSLSMQKTKNKHLDQSGGELGRPN
jgi:hypothetical protein